MCSLSVGPSGIAFTALFLCGDPPPAGKEAHLQMLDKCDDVKRTDAPLTHRRDGLRFHKVVSQRGFTICFDVAVIDVDDAAAIVCFAHLLNVTFSFLLLSYWFCLVGFPLS